MALYLIHFQWSLPPHETPVTDLIISHPPLPYVTPATAAQNFVTRKLSVINISRSRNPVLQIVVQMPSRTPGGQVSELIEVVRAYITARPGDWVSLCSTSISPPNYKVGVIEVKLFPLSAHLKIHDVQLDQATSRM
jgi:hypothetical protein